MKTLLSKIQKDLKSLQTTIEKEGNDLIVKAKKAANDIANNKNVTTKTKEIERLLETKFKKFEPALYKFLTQVSKNAARYGLDVTDIEKVVRTSVKRAKAGYTQLKTRTTGKGTGKAATTRKGKATAKRTGKKARTTASTANA